MVGARGALAVLFGILLLLRPDISLDRVVVLFGVYAALDGAWAIASALWVTRRSLPGWPVLLEGAVSLVVGVLALAWPLVPRQLVGAIAVWGLRSSRRRSCPARGSATGCWRRGACSPSSWPCSSQ